MFELTYKTKANYYFEYNDYPHLDNADRRGVKGKEQNTNLFSVPIGYLIKHVNQDFIYFFVGKLGSNYCLMWFVNMKEPCWRRT